jgi:hypothetical protein
MATTRQSSFNIASTSNTKASEIPDVGSAPCSSRNISGKLLMVPYTTDQQSSRHSKQPNARTNGLHCSCNSTIIAVTPPATEIPAANCRGLLIVGSTTLERPITSAMSITWLWNDRDTPEVAEVDFE